MRAFYAGPYVGTSTFSTRVRTVGVPAAARSRLLALASPVQTAESVESVCRLAATERQADRVARFVIRDGTVAIQVNGGPLQEARGAARRELVTVLLGSRVGLGGAASPVVREDGRGRYTVTYSTAAAQRLFAPYLRGFLAGARRYFIRTARFSFDLGTAGVLRIELKLLAYVGYRRGGLTVSRTIDGTYRSVHSVVIDPPRTTGIISSLPQK
jgi:hypothetical protein